jgi:hypothetical protein
MLSEPLLERARDLRRTGFFTLVFGVGIGTT